jgi:hypothetical protein
LLVVVLALNSCCSACFIASCVAPARASREGVTLNP